MIAFLDTSVIVAALYQGHPAHRPARSWLERGQREEIQVFLSAHSIAEVFSVLTGMPSRPKIKPSAALQMIRQLAEWAQIVSLVPADYFEVVQDLAERGFSGGIIYDALLHRAAIKADAEKLVTLNARDFTRLTAREDFVVGP